MADRLRCPQCSLLHGDGARCPYDRLVDALGSFAADLTPDEDRHLRWLAGTDYTTVNGLIAIFRRLRGVCP